MSHATEKIIPEKTPMRTFLNEGIMCLIWLHLIKRQKPVQPKHYWKPIFFDLTVEL